MKKDMVEKVLAQLEKWEYLSNLPQDYFGFKLTMLNVEEEDKYQIFAYINDEIHSKIEVYFHQETREYKLKVYMGLTDFCVVEFISDELMELELKLNKNLASLLKNLVSIEEEKLSSLVVETGILDWEYGKELSEAIEGFQLFIKPAKPFRTINGSYIILDYSNFAGNSNFVILYNILREEFSAEMKYHNIPEITYDFDSTSLEELESKLRANLLPTIQGLQKRLDNDK